MSSVLRILTLMSVISVFIYLSKCHLCSLSDEAKSNYAGVKESNAKKPDKDSVSNLQHEFGNPLSQSLPANRIKLLRQDKEFSNVQGN